MAEPALRLGRDPPSRRPRRVGLDAALERPARPDLLREIRTPWGTDSVDDVGRRRSGGDDQFAGQLGCGGGIRTCEPRAVDCGRRFAVVALSGHDRDDYADSDQGEEQRQDATTDEPAAAVVPTLRLT